MQYNTPAIKTYVIKTLFEKEKTIVYTSDYIYISISYIYHNYILYLMHVNNSLSLSF